MLRGMGAETRIYDPRGLPQIDDAGPDHPKVKELREASLWSEGHVWCSPERHGAMTGLFKSQIDWLPLDERRGAADPGPHARGLSGQRGLAVVQHRQPAPHPRPVDADDHHPQSIIRRQGLRPSSTRRGA